MLRWFESDVENATSQPSLMVGDKVFKFSRKGIAVNSESGEIIAECKALVCFMSNGYLCTIEHNSLDIKAYFSSREIQLPYNMFARFAVVRNIDDPSLPIIHVEMLTIPIGIENIITWNGVHTCEHYVMFDGEKFVYERRDPPILALNCQLLNESVDGAGARIIAFDEESHTTILIVDGKYYSVNVDEQSPGFMTYELLSKNLVLTTDPIIVGRFYD